MGLLGELCLSGFSLPSVSFCLNRFFSVGLSPICMKLGVSDVRATDYKGTEQILNM